jgi:hypothetical protein
MLVGKYKKGVRLFHLDKKILSTFFPIPLLHVIFSDKHPSM